MEDRDAPLLNEYEWEKNVKQTWDSDLQEDAEGNLISRGVNSDRDRSYRARQNRVTESVRRGLIRYLAVAIDCSASAAIADIYRPNRLVVMKAGITRFISDYFDENPISQLGIITMSDRAAATVSRLSGNPRSHIKVVNDIWSTIGKASLGNTIEVAIKSLRNVPDYGHRELLIVFASLSSVDPENIEVTIEKAREQKICISIICLAAEIHVCKMICTRTGGTCSVAVDSQHLRELLKSHTAPAPELQSLVSSTTEFIYMGFPKKTLDASPLFCFDGKKTAFQASAYVCPRCYTRATEIPTQCCTCALQLNSSTHIARSHHHLFPVPNFGELIVAEEAGAGAAAMVTDEAAGASLVKRARALETTPPAPCVGCLVQLLPGALAARCPCCVGIFCIECDIYIHDSMHSCPGCCL